MSNFKVYNAIFAPNISSTAKVVYAYLCKCTNNAGECYPSQGLIGQNCGISVSTVKKCLKELENAALISITTQMRQTGGKRSNLYAVNKCEGGYFIAPAYIFSQPLSPKAKVTLLYFCRLSGGTDKVFPSHKTTAQACGLSVAGARLAIDELEESGLVTRQAQYRADNGQRANLYSIIHPCQQTTDAPQNTVCKLKQSDEKADKPTNSTPHSKNIATTPAISHPAELKSIMTYAYNDLKSIMVKKMKTKNLKLSNSTMFKAVDGYCHLEINQHLGYDTKLVEKARPPTQLAFFF